MQAVRGTDFVSPFDDQPLQTSDASRSSENLNPNKKLSPNKLLQKAVKPMNASKNPLAEVTAQGPHEPLNYDWRSKSAELRQVAHEAKVHPEPYQYHPSGLSRWKVTSHRVFDSAKQRWREMEAERQLIMERERAHEEFRRKHPVQRPKRRSNAKRKHAQVTNAQVNDQQVHKHSKNEAHAELMAGKYILPANRFRFLHPAPHDTSVHNNNWREQSALFRAAVRAARECFEVCRREQDNCVFDILDGMSSINGSDYMGSPDAGAYGNKNKTNVKVNNFMSGQPQPMINARNHSPRRWDRTSRAVRKAIRALRRLRKATHAAAAQATDNNFIEIDEDSCMGDPQTKRHWRCESLQLRAAVRAIRHHDEVLQKEDQALEQSDSPHSHSHSASAVTCNHCNERFENPMLFNKHEFRCKQTQRMKARVQALLAAAANAPVMSQQAASQQENYEQVYVTEDGDIVCSEHVTTSAEQAMPRMELHGCAHCGRKFNLQSFRKHVSVCERVFGSHRNRSNVNSSSNENESQPSSARSSNSGCHSRHWQAESKALREAIKCAKGYQEKIHQLESIEHAVEAAQARHHDAEAVLAQLSARGKEDEHESKHSPRHEPSENRPATLTHAQTHTLHKPSDALCADVVDGVGVAEAKAPLLVERTQLKPKAKVTSDTQTQTNATEISPSKDASVQTDDLAQFNVTVHSPKNASNNSFVVDKYECLLCGMQLGAGSLDEHAAVCSHTRANADVTRFPPIAEEEEINCSSDSSFFPKLNIFGSKHREKVSVASGETAGAAAAKSEEEDDPDYCKDFDDVLKR